MSKLFIKIEGAIYKQKNDYWLKMTNLVKGEDRRTTFEYDITHYSYPANKAREEINTYWNSYKDSWTFMGNVYNNSHILAEMKLAVCKYTNNEYQDWYIIPEVREQAVHKFPVVWKDIQGNEHTHSYDWYIVWHQGHIYWMTYYHYLPQCQLYKFEGTNKTPGDFIKWTHVKNLRLVWNKTQKKYV